MRDRPADDTGFWCFARLKTSRKKASFLAQKFEKRQQRQPQDCRMIALDRIEQMNAETLQLIGSGAAQKRIPRLPAISFDEIAGESCRQLSRATPTVSKTIDIFPRDATA